METLGSERAHIFQSVDLGGLLRALKISHQSRTAIRSTINIYIYIYIYIFIYLYLYIYLYYIPSQNPVQRV